MGDRIFILLLYVDDILGQVDKEEVECLRRVQFEIGKKMSHLGMQIEIRDGSTPVHMSFYVKKLLE